MKRLILAALILASVAVYSATGIVSHGQGGSASITSDAIGGQPTCSTAIRGAVFNIEGTSSTDVWQVCQRSDLGVYSWVTK